MPATLAEVRVPGRWEATLLTPGAAMDTDRRRLDLSSRIDDPLYLTRPIEMASTLVRAPDGTEVVSFACDIAASQGYLD